MRSFLALIFFALALWRAGLDWMATVAQGEAWRFVSMETLWRGLFPNGPDVLETLVQGYLNEQVWNGLSWVLLLPAVVLPLVLGVFFWLIRRPKGVARRSLFKR